MEFIERNDKIGIVAPKVLNPNKTVQDTRCRWPKFYTFLYRRTFLSKTRFGKEHLNHYLYKDIDIEKEMKVDWSFGCCFLIKTQVFNDVGLFDERFFLFLEETDLCRRMWQHDYEVWYLPIAETVHYPQRRTTGNGTIKDLFSKYTWIHLWSWFKYFWKWRGV